MRARSHRVAAPAGRSCARADRVQTGPVPSPEGSLRLSFVHTILSQSRCYGVLDALVPTSSRGVCHVGYRRSGRKCAMAPEPAATLGSGPFVRHSNRRLIPADTTLWPGPAMPGSLYRVLRQLSVSPPRSLSLQRPSLRIRTGSHVPLERSASNTASTPPASAPASFPSAPALKPEECAATGRAADMSLTRASRSRTAATFPTVSSAAVVKPAEAPSSDLRSECCFVADRATTGAVPASRCEVCAMRGVATIASIAPLLLQAPFALAAFCSTGNSHCEARTPHEPGWRSGGQTREAGSRPCRYSIDPTPQSASQNHETRTHCPAVSARSIGA